MYVYGACTNAGIRFIINAGITVTAGCTKHLHSRICPTEHFIGYIIFTIVYKLSSSTNQRDDSNSADTGQRHFVTRTAVRSTVMSSVVAVEQFAPAESSVGLSRYFHLA